MWPLTSKDITPQFLQDRPVMLFDTYQFNLRYVGHAIARNAIASKKGTRLPTEIWLEIFAFARYDESTNQFCSKRQFRCSRALSVEESPSQEKVLQCTTSRIVNKPDCHRLHDITEIKEFERFLRTPDNFHFKSWPKLRLRHTRQQNRKFNIVLDECVGNKLLEALLPPCLFCDVAVPEIIAYFEGGNCSLCAYHRGICPWYLAEKAERYGFQVFGITIACPLCMGLDFMLEDQKYLEVKQKEVRETKWAERCEKIERRYIELGYAYEIERIGWRLLYELLD